MYAIATFGIVLMLCSSIMIVRPSSWTTFWQQFSDKPYFHVLELASRATFAAIFFLFGSQTGYPLLMASLGGIFSIATVALLLMGSKKHREFAKRSTVTFQKFFRPAGVVAFAFGGFLVFASLGGSTDAYSGQGGKGLQPHLIWNVNLQNPR